MASLAFGIVGGSLLGPVGAAIGSAIGSYIDNAYIMPALFPADDIQGPRLDDLALTAASEGSPLNFGMGPECRVGATVLWTSDLIEVKEKKKQGGKGGGGQTVTTYKYFVHYAAEFNYGRTMSKVNKMLADGTLIYDADPDIAIISDDISADYEHIINWTFDPNRFPAWQWEIVETYGIYKSPNGGPDLSQIRSGLDLVVDGFTGSNTVLNGTFRVVSSAIFTDGTSQVKVINEDAKIAGSGDTVTLDQDLPNFATDQASEITIYLGSDTQVAEPIIEGLEGGAGAVPAFRGHAYSFFNMLALGNWGNRRPQVSIIFEADASPFTVADGIELLLSRAGFTSGEWDTTGLTGNLRGFVARGPFQTMKMLQPIMLAYDILAQENMGKLKFFLRKNADEIEIADEDLAAHEEGSDAPRVARFTDTTGTDLPSEVNVDYIDPTLNYQTGSQRERRSDTPTDQTIRMEFPIVFDPVDARKIAKRVLWLPWANRQTVSLQLPPKYIHIQENDIIKFNAYNNSFRCLVTKVDRGINGLILIEALTEEASVLEFDAVAEDATPYNQKIYVPPDTMIFLLDLASLTDDHVNVPTIYAAVAAQDINATWGGGEIHKSNDDVNYNYLSDVGPEATMGYATTKLPGGVTGRYWDRVSTVEVELVNGDLESISEEEVLEGQNWAVIGNEIIGFATATLLSANKYELSGLLRGLRDTEDAIDNHSSAGIEPFVFLNDIAIIPLSHSTASIGSHKYYKAIPIGGDEDDYKELKHYHVGGSVRPFSPCHITGYREGDDDIVVNWVRRTRNLSRIFGPGAVPQIESTRIYEIDVYSGSTIVNTYTVTDIETWTYSSADQTTDGFSPPLSSLKVEIFQVSATLGIRGKGRLITLTL